LDYVLQLAEQEGIYIQLTLDDYREYSSASGSDGQWVYNPYNVSNGGPCINQNAFFTNGTALLLYEKRLRYVIGRYGYSQNLLAWEFFNEIDHDYGYLEQSNVDAWHSVMGSWLHTNDPFKHLVTTSLSYASADPALWSVPQLDYLSWHTYFSPGYQLNPAATMASDAAYYRQRYQKAVQIGEYGTDWESWQASMAVDPYLRGLRQGIWGGALGGLGTGTLDQRGIWRRPDNHSRRPAWRLRRLGLFGSRERGLANRGDEHFSPIAAWAGFGLDELAGWPLLRRMVQSHQWFARGHKSGDGYQRRPHLATARFYGRSCGNHLSTSDAEVAGRRRCRFFSF
jgi:hypothetical protein